MHAGAGAGSLTQPQPHTCGLWGHPLTEHCRHSVGFSCKEAKEAGYSCQEAKGAGYSCNEAKAPDVIVVRAKSETRLSTDAIESGPDAEAGDAIVVVSLFAVPALSCH